MRSSLPAALCLSLLASLAAGHGHGHADDEHDHYHPVERCDANIHGKRYTIHAWPLSAQAPFPLAQVNHLACSGQPHNYSLERWSPQALQSLPADELVRVGRYMPAGPTTIDNWDGSVTTAATFRPGRAKTLMLWADDDDGGRPGRASVSVGASSSALRPEGAEDPKDEVEVVVRHVRPGPKPHLNRPVVLDETGKVKREEKDERTFLQK